MADSVRQAIRAELATRLAAITTGNGYQTTYTVFENQPAAEASIAQVAAWITYGDEEGDLGSVTMGGGQANVFVIQVHAYLRKSSALITLQENALQDLRNKMHTDFKLWKTTHGATMSGYDTCETDEGVLAFDGMAFFTQGLAFTYNAGPTW